MDIKYHTNPSQTCRAFRELFVRNQGTIPKFWITPSGAISSTPVNDDDEFWVWDNFNISMLGGLLPKLIVTSGHQVIPQNIQGMYDRGFYGGLQMWSRNTNRFLWGKE